MTEEDDPSKVAPQSTSITTRMTLQDWRAFESAVVRRWHAQSKMAQLVWLGLIVALGFVAAWLSDWLDSPLQLPGVFLGAGLVFIAVCLSTREARKRYLPDADGAFLGELLYEFDADGIHARRQGSHSFSRWSTVKAVTATADHLFIWIDRIQGFVLPLRDLPPEVPRDEFVRRLQGWWGGTVVRDSAWHTASPAAAMHDAAGDQRTAGWAVTLLRLLTLRPTTNAPATAGLGLLALLACLALGTWIAIDWFRNQPDPEFFSYGAPSIAWYALLALAIAAVLARRSTPAAEFPRALAVVLAVAPVIIVAGELIDRYLAWPWMLVASVAVFVYFAAYGARALVALTGTRQPGAVVSGVAVAILLLALTEWLYVSPGVWMASEEEDDETSYETAWKESEALLFSQAARIDAAIDAIEPSSADTPAVFFVGFAGYADERVFAEEIKLAARVVGERYGSEKRTLLLVNDRRSLKAQPLASSTALRHALRRLATKMDTERDILFLALSSHGSVDSLSVSNGTLMLQDMSAADLAAALQESGIKSRVIVISACHSGSFIDELQDANTIVITASAADKTSFGCSDDRDLTYFGEAFYRDALQDASSLREAFDTARADIVRREKREDIKASEPQAWFGEEIEKQLATLP